MELNRNLKIIETHGRVKDWMKHNISTTLAFGLFLPAYTIRMELLLTRFRQYRARKWSFVQNASFWKRAVSSVGQ